MSDARERSNRELKAAVADHARLSEQQRSQMLPSGRQTVADNRIGWAMSFLTRAQALDRPRRARYVISPTGRELLAQYPNGLTERHLRTIPAFVEYTPVVRSRSGGFESAELVDEVAHRLEPLERVEIFADEYLRLEAGKIPRLDPVEEIENGISRLNADVASQLLVRLREQDPAFLEQAVLDVLVAMGYGGAEGNARRIGGTGDGGVDGVIDQDPLGLDQVYVQAKRYAADNVVGREAIQAFVGALHGNQASKGIFITTSRFSQHARDYAAKVPSRLVLIDGERLTSLMIKHGVGTQVVRSYNVVEVDEDFFE